MMVSSACLYQMVEANLVSVAASASMNAQNCRSDGWMDQRSNECHVEVHAGYGQEPER
ncbi:hypothetical protein [Bacteroides pyogenes]|uniref:hypothetical protein n=1 Tax=Bacteroides pyogenes TaxID=310300 RepID=UPI0016533BD0|nr:hypothetical protein [Bacteroides pyogenes]